VRTCVWVCSALATLAACGGNNEASIGPRTVDIPVRTSSAPIHPNAQAAKTPPPPLASKEAPFPKVRRGTLGNGLEVAVAEAHALPLVQIRVLVHAGSGYGGIAGAAELTAELLKDGGTQTMSSAELLDRIETLGATLSVEVDTDSSRLSLAVPKDKLDAALALLSDVVTRPAFDERELAKLKARKSDEARENSRANGAWMATHAMFHELYPEESPYATYDYLPSDVARINGLVVRDFHRRYWVPKNASLILVGDVEGSAASKSVEKAFGHWRGGEPPKEKFTKAIPLTRLRVLLVSRPNSAQSDIFVASLVPPRSSPNWPVLRVANQVLGGGVAGRIFSDVREQRSLAYAAYSRIVELAHDDQPLVTYVGTQTPKTGAALEGALEDIAKMATEPISDGEAESARRYLSDSFAIRMETIGSIADLLGHQWTMGLPDGYWDAYRAALRGVSTADAVETAKKTFLPERSLVVVAGDESVAPVLSHFGDVTILDPSQDFRAKKTVPMNVNASLEVPPPK
jgi:zinc protease